MTIEEKRITSQYTGLYGPAFAPVRVCVMNPGKERWYSIVRYAARGTGGPAAMKRHKVYETVIQNIPVGFSLVDKDGIVTEFNPAAEEITGYSRDEVVGKPHMELFHAAPGEESCPFIEHALLKQERIVAVEITTRKRSGEDITVVVTASPLYDDAGELAGAAEIFRDITDIKRRERERKNILSMFAHDMKNPVAVSGGFLSRLLADKAGALTEKQRKYLETIREELYKVSDLLADFLEFSRIEAKAYMPLLRPFDVEQTVRRNIEAAKVTADKKNIAISLEVAAEAASSVLADPSMIDRVIANLLDNAIAYTDAGGSIRVRVSGTDGAVLVSVADTGRGITKEQLPYIFDAFYRASRDSKGSGLGLFIAKTNIESHGGRIWVESAPGKGTTFSFTLPRH
jgi:PAS domain S-box-containing protein